MLTLITGASGGIGEALARELAARPSDLILVARSADKLQALADELARAHRIKAHVVSADLAQPGAAARVADAARAIGRVDVLVNNAGFATFGPFAASDLAVEIDEIRLNVETLTDLTKRHASRFAGRERPDPQRRVDGGVSAGAGDGGVLRDEGLRAVVFRSARLRAQAVRRAA